LSIKRLDSERPRNQTEIPRN